TARLCRICWARRRVLSAAARASAGEWGRRSPPIPAKPCPTLPPRRIVPGPCQPWSLSASVRRYPPGVARRRGPAKTSHQPLGKCSIAFGATLADQHFALSGVVGLPDDPLLLHPLHERGRPVLADLQSPLDVARGGLSVAQNDLHRLLVEIAP